MASRQNSSQMLNSQSSSSNSTSSSNAAKDKTSHGGKSDTKNKHDKSSSSLSGHVPMSSNTIINSMNNMSKRKGTSFQITSVSVTPQQQQQLQQRTDNNNGDDSADDLDESHTDDNISRITDYETPSFSEDTSFSRDDVFFAQPNAFGTAPVIPTSSQYGLAIVGPDLGGNGANLSDVHVSVSDAGINIMGQIPNKQDVDHKNERFKVVKIESTEPFKRGRWMCMDYLDHTTLQAQDDGIDGSQKEDGGENAVKTKDSGLESGLDGNDDADMEHMNDNDGFDQEVMRAEMTNHHQASHGHTMTSITVHHEYPVPPHAQSMPQKQLEQLIEGSRVEEHSSETLPSSHNANGENHQHQHAQTMTPDMIQRSLENQHGQTLPTNILMQNLGLDSSASNIQPHSVASPIPESTGEVGENRPQQDSVTSQFQQVGTGDSKQQQMESEQQQQQSAATNDNLISNSSVSDNNNNDGTQNTSSPSSSAGLGTVAEGGASETNNATAANNAPDDALNEDSESRTSAAGGKSRAHTLVPVSVAAALNINLSSLGPFSGYIGASQSKEPNSSNRVSRAASPSLGTSAENNSASGTSAVAIDNKIEQAMDLVKSHLMFAVREEVEVLKEKIAELMDRINQLEVENTILKANASQETLSQLSTAATIAVSPQAQVQTSPAQPPQSSPALSKIDASVLQVAANITNSQTQPSQNPPPVQQQNPSTAS